MMTVDEYVILVVDDSSDTVSMLNDALEQEGFSVLVALSGLQAISICKKIIPDLILLDAIMPDLNGFETCKKIKENPKFESVPVIFMTGLDSQDNVDSSFDSGAVDYIQKPNRIPELCARIRTHIRRSKQLTTSRELLDSAGKVTLAVDSNGSIVWSTPEALSRLEEKGINKISLISEFPLKIKKWLQSVKEGDITSIKIKESTIDLKYDGKKENNYLINIVKEKSKIDEKEVLAKAFNLTQREAEVLYWVAQGKSNKDLALILDISPRTANKHLESIFEKMYVENRTSAANMAIKELSKYL